ncbi:MAG TPA: sugar ABC transporter substrate-binding protein, partial [Candidatus Saccharimonadales bacterium]|nr:sugar ABC transporter substrate-binding protein [Candidatus Saccharimonadales bacterium]
KQPQSGAVPPAPTEIPIQQAQPTPIPQQQVVPPVQPPPPAAVSVSPQGSPPPIGGFPIKKILIGLFTVIFFLFLLFVVILPRFSSKGNEKVTLTYWGLWEDGNVVNPVIADFQKQNPNITVNYVKQDVKGYSDRLLTRIQNGTGPDIYRFHNSWLPMLSNLLVPLPSDVVKSSDFAKTYYPTAQKDLISHGGVYGIPLEMDSLALYTNTQILQAAGASVPATWDDFKNTAIAVTVKDENGKIKTAGAALGTFDNVTHAPDILSLLFAQQEVDVKNLSDSVPNTSAVLKFYTCFSIDDGSGCQKVWDDTLDPSMLAFAKGNLAMYIGYSWDYFVIKSMNPDLQFQITPVPHLPGQNGGTIASYWADGVSAKSKHQQAAFLFMQFLAKKETQEKLFTQEAKTRLFGEPYSRVDLADTLKSSVAYPFVAQGKAATSSFFVDSTGETGINSQMNVYLGNAVRAVLTGTSPETAIGTLSQGVTQVLGHYGQ